MEHRSADLAAIAVMAALLLSGVLAGIGRSAESTGSLTLSAAADAYVRSNSAASNFGAAKTLHARTSKTTVRKAFLRFNVPLPPGTRVTKATLRLQARSKAGAVPVEVHALSPGSHWDETTITFANAPAVADAVIASAASYKSGAAISLDVTALVTGPGPAEMAITSGSDSQRTFASREDAARAPKLVVEYAGTTAPDPRPGADPVIAAAGDIACKPGQRVTATSCQQRATSDLLDASRLAAVLTLGDNQYDCGSLDEFNGSFATSWGRLKSLIRPIPGDDEYECDPRAAGYFAYFGTAAGDPAKGYYSYDLGAWHLVALNSGDECAPVACDAGSAQLAWLKADLAAHPAGCTLAYWHAPRFASPSGESGLKDLWTVLHAAGVDVVLNGHAHQYERFAPMNPKGTADPAGIREFIVGTGGKSHADAATPRAGSEALSRTFGVLELTLRPRGYDWRFRPAAGATFSDSGTGSCH